MNTDELINATTKLTHDYRDVLISKANRTSYSHALMQLEEDWIEWLYTEYADSHILHGGQFRILYNYAWTEGHAFGYRDVEQRVSDIVDLYEKVRKEEVSYDLRANKITHME